MSKQETAVTCPQQLALDFQNPGSESAAASETKIVLFVDSTTKLIRERAINRVKSAGIFNLKTVEADS